MSYPAVAPPRRRPMWFTALCILLCVPVLVLPFASGMEEVKADLGALFTYLPVYVCASALCAWISYARRRDVAWILIAVLLLTYLAVYLLARSYEL